jgi:UDP-glucose 4-epimerase
VKIGITGGAGFIGGHVAEVAISRGHQVVTFDRLGRRPYEGYTGDVMLGDVRDDVDVCELAAHTDGIIHLAACLGTQETIRNPRPAADTQIRGGLNFLEACAQYDIPGVYIGVGNHWMYNTYSITKTTIERFVTMFNRERGTRVNVVRLVNAVGPRQSVAPPYGAAKVRKIGPSFICRALTGAPIEIYGDGEQVSDLVAVEDGALALVKALEKAAEGKVFDRAVEVGTVKSHTVNEVAREVVAAAGSDSEIRHLPMRPGEIPGATVTADLSTLELVDIDPANLATMPEIVSHTVAWFRENWLPGYLASR